MFSSLKELHTDKKAVFAYWQKSAAKMAQEGQFALVKDQMIFDHTWYTTIKAVVEEGKIKNSDLVLDAGCGWGRIASGVKFFIPRTKIIGIDANYLRVKAARGTLADLGLSEGVLLHLGDVDHIPCPDNIFDAVVCARVLQYVPDPRGTIKELRRVLKPGGRLVLTVPNKHNPLRLCSYKRKLYSPGEVKEWLSSNELADVSCRTIGFLPAVKRLHWTSKWLIVERAQYIPLLSQLGGLVLGLGTKR